MNNRRLVKWGLGVLFSMLFSSCMRVSAYQQMYTRNAEMATEDKGIKQFEKNAQTYREGSSGANGGKTGGGCGCN